MLTHFLFWKFYCFISFSLYKVSLSVHYHIPPINFSSPTFLPSPFLIYHLVIFSPTQRSPFHSFIKSYLLFVLHSIVVSTFCSCSRSIANPVLQRTWFCNNNLIISPSRKRPVIIKFHMQVIEGRTTFEHQSNLSTCGSKQQEISKWKDMVVKVKTKTYTKHKFA